MQKFCGKQIPIDTLGLYINVKSGAELKLETSLGTSTGNSGMHNICIPHPHLAHVRRRTSSRFIPTSISLYRIRHTHLSSFTSIVKSFRFARTLGKKRLTNTHS